MGRVTLQLNGADIYGSVWISLSNGVFKLDQNSPLTISEGGALGALRISPDSISLYVPGQFHGLIELPVASTGGTPILSANIPGETQVIWMTENGQRLEPLAPGGSIELSGLVDW